MIRFRADARQLQALVRRLAGGYHETRTTKHRLALKVAKAVKVIAERRVRVTKTAPDGTPWRRWSPSYAQTRSGKHSLLVDTRELLRSFKHSATPAGAFAVVENQAPHAGFAMKVRPFLGVGPLEQAAAENIVGEWLEGLT